MTREEAINRLKRIAEKAVHTPGETPLVMSLDDGIAVRMAISALQQPEIIRCKDCARFEKKRGCNLVEGLNVAKTDSFCSYAERKEGEAE